MQKIDELFKFSDGDIIVVGCSAGPDSMALLDMLVKIRDKYNLKLIVAHVDHNVREESLEESCYVKLISEKNNVIFENMIIDEYGDDNFENEARVIRYNFFASLIKKYNANYLMTAHHGDDLIETILMKIVRGSNLSGYAGFKKVVDMEDYKIVRPLIHYTKDDLIKYNEDNNIKYYIDKTNFDDSHTRNRYRKRILSFLKEESSDVHKKFYRYSEKLLEASNYIQKVIDDELDKIYKDGLLIDKFLEEDFYIQKEILYSLLSDYYQDDLILVSDTHIELIYSLINGKKSNGFINLPNDVVAKKEYNMLKLERATDDVASYEVELDKRAELPNGFVIEKVSYLETNGNDVCRIDSSEVSLPLIIRTRRFGDRISVKGMNGTKKIKDIFIDKKIPIKDRDITPVVCDSKGNIVWIPGIIKSKFDKNKTDSYNIMLKYKGGKDE